MMAITRAMLIYGILFAAMFAFIGVQGVPKTIGLIQPIIAFLLVSASRAVARIWLGDLYQLEIKKSSSPKVLIYGAGSAGRQLASGIANSNKIRVAGFLDDDDRLHGHVLNGLYIYNPADLEEIVNQKGVTDVLLAMPSASQERRNQILVFLICYHNTAVMNKHIRATIGSIRHSNKSITSLVVKPLNTSC
jgi:FlaA1/EpsC-like NDP-sugar epimerase